MVTDNIVVSSSPWLHTDITTIFGDEEVLFVPDTSLPTLLAELGIYKSTSKARQANRVGPIPKGYTEFKASKKKTLYIWNPTE
ncbi:hypothetical protein [Pseudoalteromonas phage J2-1_QLiu-2017]|nr:hypothetical protein [Pseudoalteromonas phage J2-1_QLiu-2017]